MATKVSPKGVPIRWLLLGTNAIVLALPLFAFFGLRIYDTYLLRQTERQLIAQAVFTAEAWRDALSSSGALSADSGFRPPGKAQDKFIPIEPRIDLGTAILPSQPKALPCAHVNETALAKAAQQVGPLMRRAQVFSLAAIRILDTKGCVLATTRGELGDSLAIFPEVQSALQGEYGSVTRHRISDDPVPPLVDIRRRGRIRVFSALPVFSDQKLVGVVRVSRTSLSAERSLWLNRRGLLLGALTCAFLMIAGSLLFTQAITRPLKRLRDDARSIADDKHVPAFTQGAWTPIEFRALAESLSTMTKKLRERAEYTASYTANVTHELKSPLTSIRGAAELLRNDIDAMSKAQKDRFVLNIELDTLRMERLVNQLLHLSKIENATQEAETKEIVINDLFADLALRYPERVTFSVTTPALSICMNPDNLTSVVVNLIENALEHDAESMVTVEASLKKEHVVLSVCDSGPGIPTDNISEVFERFFTTKKDSGGTGLGLPLVKAIVEGRGGSVQVQSAPGHTEFTVVL